MEMRKFSLCRRSEGNRGFTILESLLGGSLMLLTAILVFMALQQYLVICERLMTRIELTETLMTVEYALFQFSRYSSSAELLPGGKRLRLNFTGNGIEIYPVKGTLVVLNRGAANPIAEGCGEGTGFQIEETSRNKKIVKIHIPFYFGKRGEELALAVGIRFWGR